MKPSLLESAGVAVFVEGADTADIVADAGVVTVATVLSTADDAAEAV